MSLTGYLLSWINIICYVINGLSSQLDKRNTVKRVLFAGVNFRDIEITANSRFLIFAVDRIKKINNKVLVLVY